MSLIFHPNRHCFLALIMLGTVASTTVAMADPVVSTKVRTITIRPQSAEDHRDPLVSTTHGPKVHSLTILPVRPRSPGENRDASGRQLTAQQALGHAASGADFHAVHTIKIRQDPDPHPASAPGPVTVPTRDADRRVIRTITVRPDPAAPEMSD